MSGPTSRVLIVSFVVLSTFVLVWGHEFPRASYVTWKEESVNVLHSKAEFELKIFFTDPCNIIKEQFPTLSWVDEVNYHEMHHPYYYCSENYLDYIVRPIDELVTRYNLKRRNKRGIPLLGLIGGVWLSNVIDSYFNDNDEIAKHESQQDAALLALNRRQNYTTEAIVELSRTQSLLVDKVNQLYTVTRENSREMIRLQFALTRLSMVLAAKKAAIEKLRFGLVNGKKLDLSALNTLLDTKIFEDIDSESLEFLSFEKLGKKGYIIHFYGHKIREDTRVYSVRALTHWVNLTESPSQLIEYAGPPKVLVNLERNCVLGITDLSAASLSQECEASNSRSADLDLWHTIKVGNPFQDLIKTVFVEELPKVNVYCLGRPINIAGIVMDCPPYAFALPADLKWNTSDRSFPGYAKTAITFDVRMLLPEHIVPADIQVPNNTLFVETDALKRIYNLTAQLELEKMNSLVLNTPIGGVSQSVFTKIILCSSGCLMCILIWFWVHNHKTIKRGHEGLIATITAHLENRAMYPDLPQVASTSIAPSVISDDCVKHGINRYKTWRKSSKP